MSFVFFTNQCFLVLANQILETSLHKIDNTFPDNEIFFQFQHCCTVLRISADKIMFGKVKTTIKKPLLSFLSTGMHIIDFLTCSSEMNL